MVLQTEYNVKKLFVIRRIDFRKPGARFSKLSPGNFNREIKIHAYGTRQTANISWEFLKIENKQIKTIQNDSFG